jgi:hypothetical protein
VRVPRLRSATLTGAQALRYLADVEIVHEEER